MGLSYASKRKVACFISFFSAIQSFFAVCVPRKLKADATVLLPLCCRQAFDFSRDPLRVFSLSSASSYFS